MPAPPKALKAYMSALGRRGGTISGARRMTNLTPLQRQRIARNAARVRWTAQKNGKPTK
jgi:hypothetical protein